jgi:2-C-methyl-D-erythritol 4-phosphate cytidylyltransferase
MSTKYVVITAGGAGVRMNTHLPKQFLELNGNPVIMHTINRFVSYFSDIRIILVLPAAQIENWKKLCDKYNFQTRHLLVEGGPTRFHSVKNGLTHVPDNSIVAIHDGVRPLVSTKTISEVYRFAEKFGNAIPVVDVSESVRMVDGPLNKVIDRCALRIVQTPQGFKSELIKKAFNVSYRETFTDDASVLEFSGERIYLVQGNPENIKITKPSDLLIAEALVDRID